MHNRIRPHKNNTKARNPEDDFFIDGVGIGETAAMGSFEKYNDALPDNPTSHFLNKSAAVKIYPG